MPVLLGGNIAVSHEAGGKTDFRRFTSRRQSRLCVYLHTAKSDDGHSESVFKDSDVKNVLKDKEDRKKKFNLDKLKLVWKGTYKFTKTSQEAMQELLDNRNTKQKVRLAPHLLRGKSSRLRMHDKTIKRNVTELAHEKSAPHEKIAAHSDKSRNLVSCTKSVISKGQERLSTGTVGTKTRMTTLCCAESCSKSVHDFSTQGAASEIENWSVPDERSKFESTISRPSLCGQYVQRFSRSIFHTKKATDNQERNLFLFRIEKKRHRNEAAHETTSTTKIKTSSLPTTDSTNEEHKRMSVDSIKKIEKAMQLEREKLVPELKSKVGADTILRAYLSEQFLDLNLQGTEVEELRRIYKSTILNRPVINNLIMKHPDMLPSRIFKDLVKFKKGFEVNPIYSLTVVKADNSLWREIYRKNLSKPSGNTLIDLETDIPLYANFYKPLIEKRNENTVVDESWLRERKFATIRENLLHMTVKLRISRQNPGSTVRFDLLRIFAAAGRNDRLLRQLGLSVEGWLDQLIKGLHSPFKSVREETCEVLCLMTSCYPVMRELYLSKYFDVIQDLCLSILRACDQYEDTFPEYYILLAHIIHYCPSRSIIECIIERWTNFRCVGLILHWPRLLYYALRYWSDDALYLGSRYFSIRVTKALETALQRPLTAKVCRCALYHSQVRFFNVSRFFTIYYDKGNARKTFFDALAAN